MSSKRVLGLHCPAGNKHRTTAHALREAGVGAGIDVEVIDAYEHVPRWFGRGYVGTHLGSTRHLPWAYGYGYRRLNRRHPVGDSMRRAFDRRIGAGLLRFVAEQRADVVISTHFFPLSVLGQARLAGKLPAPLVGIVTDYAAHAFWAEPGVDMYCTAAGGAAHDLMRYGVASNEIATTGIPIRTAFEQVPPLRPRSFDGELNVLVTSGGFGVGPMARTIASFAGLDWAHLTVVCGDAPQRVAQVRAAAAQARVRADVVGFERDMPRRLAEAHVVVGKPGGLTSSEAMACGRPMLLVGTCPGQEQHNEDWLCLNGAAQAVAAEQTGRQLDWLRRTDKLDAMAAAARRLGAPTAARRALSASLDCVASPAHAA